jgi:hypothetical protein
MTTVRIYQPSKTAMQAGRGKTKRWVVEFETDDPLTTESLMGWVESYDMSQELSLSFPSLSEALHFAVVNGFSYTVCNPSKIFMIPKSYALNFTCPRIRGRAV